VDHTQAIEKLTESVGLITKGFDELKNAHEVNKTTGGAAAQAMIDKLADDIGIKLESVQTQQQKLEAAMQRVSVTDGSDAAKATRAMEKKALTTYLQGGDKAFLKLNADEQKAMSTDDNPNGGYLVPVGTLGMINGRIFETSPMRKLATVRPTALKSVTVDIDDDEADGRWEGEGTSQGETDTPETGQIEIVARKMEAEPRVTVEDLQDSALDLEPWLAGKVSDKFSRMENAAFVNGTGPLKPRGFLTYGAWSNAGVYERGKIEQLLSGSTSDVTPENLIDLQGALLEGYQNGANWSMNRSVLTKIMKIKGTDMYRFLNLQPATGPQGQVLGAVMSLLEKPVVLMSDMPTITSGSLSIAYGNMSKSYTILDRVGVSVQRDPYTSKGRVKFYTTKRVGGAVTNFDALKLMKFATS
jgi:HK97 family phage major capsid protein